MGQFSLSSVGTYNVQCILDDTITDKFTTYRAGTGGIQCAYRSLPNNAQVCAVKPALDPLANSGLVLSDLVMIPTPYPYCTTSQLTDPAYSCIDAPAGAQIVTRQQ